MQSHRRGWGGVSRWESDFTIDLPGGVKGPPPHRPPSLRLVQEAAVLSRRHPEPSPRGRTPHGPRRALQGPDRRCQPSRAAVKLEKRKTVL